MSENRFRIDLETKEVLLIREEGETLAQYRLRQAELKTLAAVRARELMFGPCLSQWERQILFIRGLQQRDRAHRLMQDAEAALPELSDEWRAWAEDCLRLLREELDWPPRTGRKH